MNDSYSDKDNIIMTSAQWELTANQYMVINKGTLCIEIKPDGAMFLKVGVGDKYYKDLPYINSGSGDGNVMDLSSYAKISYVDNKLELVDFNIEKLKSMAHLHSNIDILDKITAHFTAEEKDKLSTIEDHANNYKLPIASETQLGGIKLGPSFTIEPDGTINIDESSLPIPPAPEVMTGATNDSDGKSGLTPKPSAGDENKFLRGDGTFQEIKISNQIIYDDFVGAIYPYEDIDPITGEKIIVTGEGKPGLVPAPPPRDSTVEYMEGNKYLRYDGEWAPIPQPDVFVGIEQIYDEGQAGLVPAPVSKDLNKFLASDGQWRGISEFGYISKYLSEGFDVTFRTQIIDKNVPIDFMSIIRSEKNINFAPTNGVGIALGAKNANGYLYMDPIKGDAFVGGGVENSLNWVKQISFTDHTHPVDNILSDTSENPVQNRVITDEVNKIKNDFNDLIKINFILKSEFPNIGDPQIMYVDTTDNKIYRWDIDKNKYVMLSPEFGDKTFNFNQVTPLDEWHIKHNLNKFPSVVVIDSAGSNVIGEVSYVDQNNITIHFSSALSGQAFLN